MILETILWRIKSNQIFKESKEDRQMVINKWFCWLIQGLNKNTQWSNLLLNNIAMIRLIYVSHIPPTIHYLIKNIMPSKYPSFKDIWLVSINTWTIGHFILISNHRIVNSSSSIYYILFLRRSGIWKTSIWRRWKK